jgi:hypothetical protein
MNSSPTANTLEKKESEGTPVDLLKLTLTKKTCWVSTIMKESAEDSEDA